MYCGLTSTLSHLYNWVITSTESLSIKELSKICQLLQYLIKLAKSLFLMALHLDLRKWKKIRRIFACVRKIKISFSFIYLDLILYSVCIYFVSWSLETFDTEHAKKKEIENSDIACLSITFNQITKINRWFCLPMSTLLPEHWV